MAATDRSIVLASIVRVIPFRKRRACLVQLGEKVEGRLIEFFRLKKSKMVDCKAAYVISQVVVCQVINCIVILGGASQRFLWILYHSCPNFSQLCFFYSFLLYFTIVCNWVESHHCLSQSIYQRKSLYFIFVKISALWIFFFYFFGL